MDGMKSITSKYKPNLNIVEMIFMIFCMWYYIVPSASQEINFMIMLALCAVYIFYVMQVTPKKYTVETVKVIVVAVIISFWFLVLTETKTIDSDASNYIIKRFFSKFQQTAFAFFPLLLFARVQQAGTDKQKKILCTVVFGFFVYVMFNTWQELLINENATRHWENFTEIADEDIGTYAFIYAVSALIPSMLIIFGYVNRIYQKILCVVVIIALFLFLIQAQYTLSILIGFISIILYFMLCTRNITMKIALLCMSPIILILLPNFLMFIASRLGDSHIAIRLNEVAQALTGEGLGYNLGGRFELYGKTILAFLRSPIYGHRNLDFDGHATLLTVLSDTGILGGVPYYYLYFSSRKRVSRLLDDNEINKRFSPVFIALILMGLTNPIHSTLPLYIVVWFLAPLLIDLMSSKRRNYYY